MKKLILGLGAAGALLIGLFAVAAVGAQEGDGVTDSVTKPVDSIVSKVAEKLGVGEDEFVDAWNESATEVVDEMVADGVIDAETGEMIKSNIEDSDGIWLPRHKHPHPRLHGKMLIATAANTVLDLEEGELREAFQDGQSLLDVAVEAGYEEEQFKTDLLAEVQSILDQKVADDELDQEKADAIYDRIAENIDDIINHTKGDGPNDAGFGRFGPRGFGAPETDAATTDA